VLVVAAVYEYQELNLNEERHTSLRVSDSDHTAPSDENDYEPIPSDVTANAEVYSYVDVPGKTATKSGSLLGRKFTECNYTCIHSIHVGNVCLHHLRAASAK